MPSKSEALIALQDAIVDEADGDVVRLYEQAKELRVRMGGDFNSEIIMAINAAALNLSRIARDLDRYIGETQREERQRVR